MSQKCLRTENLILPIFFCDRERKCARAILRLAQQFPGDPGAMAPLFLNYLLIAPGESFFMAANEPHAYVAGEIIECMACSDNVVSRNSARNFEQSRYHNHPVEVTRYSYFCIYLSFAGPSWFDTKI